MPKTWTVASEGTGGKADFKTVQAALDAVPENNKEPILIRIRPGTYKELLTLHKSKGNVTLRGESAERTVLTFDRSARTLDPTGKPYGTSGSASATLSADNFRAENLTFANSAGRGRDVGQAVAVKTQGDQMVFENCRFLGWQDTLYANGDGHQRFTNCYIEGDVDFIFGHAAAVFEKCKLVCKGEGYVTAQARDTERDPGGYLFWRCDISAAPEVRPGSVYLGRPWRDFARVLFWECTLGAQIRPVGWHNWDKPEREKTAFFAECNNKGPGAETKERAPWSKQLTVKEAEAFRRALAGV
ncbi:pectinesterase family protein [Armatimonas rosea]|uniref:Pectinesterase n=1 Tax=Armatimonas rosea TaxID=685828 RepID=A0A7W9W8B4_ARMRO|nr:pectinesterase family protein [Armatimonas rosea]MBB6052593.1 pectinesterase [Armatimonas rosea]